MDLSKAYDCLPRNLVIAKLEAYGLDTSSLRFLFDYLSCRKQRAKMGSAYSNWSEVFVGFLKDQYSLEACDGFIQPIFYKRFDRSSL